MAARFPVRVTVAWRSDLPSLVRRAARSVLREALEAGAQRTGFRLVHGSLGKGALELIVEAKDREALARGLQGLCVRVAKRLNRHWGRRGPVFSDRYEDHILRTPSQVAAAWQLVGAGPGGRSTLQLYRDTPRTRLLRGGRR